jgi:GGDEF domain-containing protein
MTPVDEQHRALFDPETGLPGEALVRDRLAVSLARAHRVQRFVMVAELEFHVRNARLPPHWAPAITRRLHAAIRADDTVARVGPGVFVVICNDLAHAHEANIIIDRLLEEGRYPLCTVDPHDELVVDVRVIAAQRPEPPVACLGRVRAADPQRFDTGWRIRLTEQPAHLRVV